MRARRRGERGRDRVWRVLLVPALLALAGPALAAAPPDPQPPRPAAAVVSREHQPRPDRFRIVAFGSSSTEGVGASAPAFTYPAQVERLLNDALRGRPAVTVLNRGIGGEDIDDMVRRLQPDVLAGKPDLVIWQVGTNDPLRAVPLEHFKKLLRAGLAAMRTAGAEVLLMEPQACPAMAAADPAGLFVAAVRDAGAAFHVDVLRRTALMHAWVAEGLATERGLVGPDGLHMTDRGYALLAKAVVDEVSATSPALRGLVAQAADPKHL